MVLTFGPSADGAYTGAAYEGVALLPFLAGKVNFIFEWLFGFTDPHLVAFPITALGAVGAALGLVPNFISQGWVDGNAFAALLGNALSPPRRSWRIPSAESWPPSRPTSSTRP